MTVNEFENTIDDAKKSLDNIIAETEKFTNENFLNGGLFSFSGGWNDACGKRISEYLISSVRQAVSEWLNIYDCKSELDKINDGCGSLISIFEEAKKELQ